MNLIYLLLRAELIILINLIYLICPRPCASLINHRPDLPDLPVATRKADQPDRRTPDQPDARDIGLINLIGPQAQQRMTAERQQTWPGPQTSRAACKTAACVSRRVTRWCDAPADRRGRPIA